MFGQTHSTVQDTTIRTTPADAIALVAYLLTADNDHRPLLTRLSDANQPVICSRNPFSRPHPTRLVYI